MEIEAEIKEEVIEEAKEDSNLIEPLTTPPEDEGGRMEPTKLDLETLKGGEKLGNPT